MPVACLFKYNLSCVLNPKLTYQQGVNILEPLWCGERFFY